jgi:hypothetical protein
MSRSISDIRGIGPIGGSWQVTSNSFHGGEAATTEASGHEENSENDLALVMGESIVQESPLPKTVIAHLKISAYSR